LIGDRFEENFIGGMRVRCIELKGECSFSEAGQTLIGGRAECCSYSEIKRKREGRAAHE